MPTDPALVGTLQESIGLGASFVPYSTKNQLDGIKTKLVHIDDTLSKIAKNQNDIDAKLERIAFALESQANTANESLVYQKMALIDQITNNSFNQEETKAALRRSDIEPQADADVSVLVKQNVEKTIKMNAVSELSTSLTQSVQNLINNTVNWIKSTGPVIYAQEALKSTVQNSAILSTVKKAFDPVGVANSAIKKVNQTNISAGMPAGTQIVQNEP